MPRPLATLPALLLAALLALGAAAPRPVEAGEASAVRAARLLGAMKSTRLKQVRWKDMTLVDMTAWLRIATGWNILVNQAALAKAGIDPAAITFTIELDDVSVASLLDLLLEPHGMAVRVADNLVFLTSKADAQGRLLTRVYGISHLTWQKVDFIAPDINLRPSNFTPPEEYVPEVVVEDDPLVTGDAVADLLKEIVTPGEWGTEGWSIRATRTYLVIRAPVAVHAAIPRALDIISALK